MYLVTRTPLRVMCELECSGEKGLSVLVTHLCDPVHQLILRK